MTKEQAFFIQMLSDHLNGRKTEYTGDPDWKILLLYARKHQVSGMIYVQARSFMPPDILGAFRQDALATSYYYMNRTEVFAEVRQALTEAGIDFFVIKGPLVAEWYPVPSMRAMGDIDLVVHPEDREACHDILIRNGFACSAKQKDREWQYHKNTLEIELHDRLVYKEAVNESGQDEFFNDCWKFVRDGEPDWQFHLMFLIFHLRKHLMNSGAGFRQFMDLAVLARRLETDWQLLEQNLKITGMNQFAGKCYGFLYLWFGITTPLTEEIDDEFYENATQKIFEDGIFGFDNADNEDSEVINQVRHKLFPKLGMIRIALSQVFPARKTLENSEPYTYLKKRPVLLPAAWIHRMIRGNSKRKGKSMIGSIKKSFATSESIEKRNDMLTKWGL